MQHLYLNRYVRAPTLRWASQLDLSEHDVLARAIELMWTSTFLEGALLHFPNLKRLRVESNLPSSKPLGSTALEA